MTEAEDPNKRNFTQLAKEVNLTNNRDELPWNCSQVRIICYDFDWVFPKNCIVGI